MLFSDLSDFLRRSMIQMANNGEVAEELNTET